MNARTSRLSAPIDDMDMYKDAGSKAAYANSLDSAVYSDNSVLQRNVQQILRAELQSEAMKGTSENSSAQTRMKNIHFIEWIYMFKHIFNY